MDPPPATIVTDAIAAGLLPWHLADTFDDETTGFYWWGEHELYALAILIGDKPYVFFGDALRVAADQLCAIAEDPARELIGFNIKFDFHFLREQAIQLRARVHDAAVALFLLDENKWSGQSHGLKHAVKQIFGFEMVEFKDMLGWVTEETGEVRTRKCKGCLGKGWRSRAHVVCDVCDGTLVETTLKTRRRQRRIEEVPIEEVAKYAGHDAWFTKQVWLWAYERLSRKPKLWRNFDEIQMPLLRSLYYMEHRGIRIDREATEALRARFVAEIQEIDATILARTGCRVVGATAIDEEDGNAGAVDAVPGVRAAPGEDTSAAEQNAARGSDAQADEQGLEGGSGPEDRVEDVRAQPTLEVNLDSPAQTDWFLYTFLGLKRPPFRPSRKAKDGSRVASKYQTDENCLLYIWKHQGQEIPKLLWRRRKLAKYVGTYLNNMLQFAQPRELPPSPVLGEGQGEGTILCWILYPNFNQTAARTGRLSSSKPLNFQNIPHDAQFRRLFIARPGCVFVIWDAKQIELRFLAHFSQEPELVEAYRDPNRDLHQETADKYDIDRYTGKTANFAEVYEVYGNTFAMQLFRDTEGKTDLTKEQAQRILDSIRAGRPAVARWKQNVIAFCRKNGFIKTIEDQLRRLPNINAQEWGKKKYGERQAVNAIIQGSVGGMFARYLGDLWFHTIALLQVHDEVVGEAAIEDAQEVARQGVRLLEAFTERYQMRVPILAEVGIGNDWSAK